MQNRSDKRQMETAIEELQTNGNSQPIKKILLQHLEKEKDSAYYEVYFCPILVCANRSDTNIEDLLKNIYFYLNLTSSVAEEFGHSWTVYSLGKFLINDFLRNLPQTITGIDPNNFTDIHCREQLEEARAKILPQLAARLNLPSNEEFLTRWKRLIRSLIAQLSTADFIAAPFLSNVKKWAQKIEEAKSYYELFHLTLNLQEHCTANENIQNLLAEILRSMQFHELPSEHHFELISKMFASRIEFNVELAETKSIHAKLNQEVQTLRPSRLMRLLQNSDPAKTQAANLLEQQLNAIQKQLDEISLSAKKSAQTGMISSTELEKLKATQKTLKTIAESEAFIILRKTNKTDNESKTNSTTAVTNDNCTVSSLNSNSIKVNDVEPRIVAVKAKLTALLNEYNSWDGELWHLEKDIITGEFIKTIPEKNSYVALGNEVEKRLAQLQNKYQKLKMLKQTDRNNANELQTILIEIEHDIRALEKNPAFVTLKTAKKDLLAKDKAHEAIEAAKIKVQTATFNAQVNVLKEKISLLKTQQPTCEVLTKLIGLEGQIDLLAYAGSAKETELQNIARLLDIIDQSRTSMQTDARPSQVTATLFAQLPSVPTILPTNDKQISTDANIIERERLTG